MQSGKLSNLYTDLNECQKQLKAIKEKYAEECISTQVQANVCKVADELHQTNLSCLDKSHPNVVQSREMLTKQIKKLKHLEEKQNASLAEMKRLENLLPKIPDPIEKARRTLFDHPTRPDVQPMSEWEQYFGILPLGFGKLSDWVYNCNNPLPIPDAKLLGEPQFATVTMKIPTEKSSSRNWWTLLPQEPNQIEINFQVQLAYIKLLKADRNVLVIRGTVPEKIENIMLSSSVVANMGNVINLARKSIEDKLDEYEREFGECAFVTGHSLGGKLAEVACERPSIMGITFNSLLGKKRDNIISFRMDHDIAGCKGLGHTDHWVDSETGISRNAAQISGLFVPLESALLTDILLGARDHGIESLNRSLNVKGNRWDNGDIYKVKRANPTRVNQR